MDATASDTVLDGKPSERTAPDGQPPRITPRRSRHGVPRDAAPAGVRPRQGDKYIAFFARPPQALHAMTHALAHIGRLTLA
ncbi:MAG: hypothetical protein ABI806_27670, partial [Candidatus Solibacter sp.]